MDGRKRGKKEGRTKGTQNVCFCACLPTGDLRKSEKKGELKKSKNEKWRSADMCQVAKVSRGATKIGGVIERDTLNTIDIDRDIEVNQRFMMGG